MLRLLYFTINIYTISTLTLPKMPCRIHLRHDQLKTHLPHSQSPNVCIYAPNWTAHGLQTLGETLQNISFTVTDGHNQPMDSFTLTGDPLSLIQLHKVTLIEPYNIDGRIRTDYYSGNVETHVIYALRDLVRQSVIVGLDETEFYGGFPHHTAVIPQTTLIYICNLIGLQFQQPYNSGRMILYEDNGHDNGFLDNLIFTSVVGEPRDTLANVKQKHTFGSNRYQRVNNVYVDTFAYSKFVANDVILSGLAIEDMAAQYNHSIHFKFLQYGIGFFAGPYREVLARHILPAVVDGLEILFRRHKPKQIQSIEFPFYTEDEKSKQRLDTLGKEFNLKYKFSTDDALKFTAPDHSYVIATTNCADPHSVTGNEMERGSVDAAIAQNIKSKANIFSTHLNKAMKQKFLQL